MEEILMTISSLLVLRVYVFRFFFFFAFYRVGRGSIFAFEDVMLAHLFQQRKLKKKNNKCTKPPQTAHSHINSMV